MLKLHAIQAQFGDCLLLEYGTAAAPKFILVDGGPPDTFTNHLSSVLAQKVAPNGGRLERVMLSHVDNDHIIGLLDLFAELRRQRANGEAELVSVGGLWHNSFARTLDPNGNLEPRLVGLLAVNGMEAVMADTGIAVQGIGEGNRLRQSSLLLNVPLNADLPDPITVDTAVNPVTFENLTLTVVGPTQANLDALRVQWERWLDRHENAIAGGNPEVMANSDRSVPNLSSICVVAEADGKRLLLTGDQRSDFLYEGLEARGFLDAQGRAHFDVLKVPHHGSDRNITRHFFEHVTADRYVISADGTNDNPDLPTLLWLVDAAHAQQRDVEIIVTNQTDSTREIVQVRPPAAHNYALTILAPGTSSIEVALA
jgi:hypothetical protein